jgi:hypothetical protein
MKFLPDLLWYFQTSQSLSQLQLSLPLNLLFIPLSLVTLKISLAAHSQSMSNGPEVLSGIFLLQGFNSSSSMHRCGSLRTALPASSAPTRSTTTSCASNMVLHGLGDNIHDPTVNPFVPIAASSSTAFIVYLLPFTVCSFLLFYIVFALLFILYT